MNVNNLIPWHTSRKRVPVRTYRSPFALLQSEVNDLFDGFFESVWSDAPVAHASAVQGAERAFAPKIKLEEAENELLVTVDLPGLEQKDVDISLEEDRLVISGERKHESKKKEGGYSYYETFHGRFERTIPLNFAIDNDKVSAVLKNGELTIKLPKEESNVNKTRKVSVKSE